MAKVLGIVGSPRGEMGQSHQVVSKVLAGARAAGAQTEVLYLVDEEPEYCIHCGHGCFEEGDCIQEEGATVRSQRVEAADALVICAPVYCWQPNAMTVALFDKMRLSTRPWNRGPQHGKPALGIAVAGGTGTGVFPALQSIYAWLCAWKYRPLDPIPVTRFNMDRVLDAAGSYGRALAERGGQPFEAVWEQLLAYDNLPYMDYGRVDEFRWLAEQIVAGLEARKEGGARVEEVARLLDAGRIAAAEGDEEGEAQAYVRAYRAGRKAWEER